MVGSMTSFVPAITTLVIFVGLSIQRPLEFCQNKFCSFWYILFRLLFYFFSFSSALSYDLFSLFFNDFFCPAYFRFCVLPGFFLCISDDLSGLNQSFRYFSSFGFICLCDQSFSLIFSLFDAR